MPLMLEVDGEIRRDPLEVDWWLERWSSEHYLPCEKNVADRGDQFFCRVKSVLITFSLGYFFWKKRDQLLTEMGFGTAPRNLRNPPNLVDRNHFWDNAWDQQHMYKFANF